MLSLLPRIEHEQSSTIGGFGLWSIRALDALALERSSIRSLEQMNRGNRGNRVLTRNQNELSRADREERGTRREKSVSLVRRKVEFAEEVGVVLP